VTPVSVVRDLGVYVDSCVTMSAQATGVPKTGFDASGTRKNTSDGDKFRIFATHI